jgi:hypothetical protein
MGATVKRRYAVQMCPYIMTELNLVDPVAGLEESIAHGGPTGCSVARVSYDVVKIATDGSIPALAHVAADDDTTVGTDTVALKFYTTPGGSLAGAEVKVYCHFDAAASGGIGA